MAKSVSHTTCRANIPAAEAGSYGTPEEELVASDTLDGHAALRNFQRTEGGRQSIL